MQKLPNCYKIYTPHPNPLPQWAMEIIKLPVQNHQTIISKYDSLEDETINYLIQFYQVNAKPKEICFKAFDATLLADALEVQIYEAKLGKKKEILDMANANAKFNLENKRNIYRNQILKKIRNNRRIRKPIRNTYPYAYRSF